MSNRENEIRNVISLKPVRINRVSSKIFMES